MNTASRLLFLVVLHYWRIRSTGIWRKRARGRWSWIFARPARMRQSNNGLPRRIRCAQSGQPTGPVLSNAGLNQPPSTRYSTVCSSSTRRRLRARTRRSRMSRKGNDQSITSQEAGQALVAEKCNGRKWGGRSFQTLLVQAGREEAKGSATTCSEAPKIWNDGVGLKPLGWM